MTSPRRAAVIGASGIGKHHAKWLNALGAEVVAIAGTTAPRLDQARSALREIFPFDGRCFTDLPSLLSETDPDLVHICTPPDLHCKHVMALAGHRCHLMCEKPLTWDDNKPPEQLLSEARQMVEACQRPGRVCAANLQYTAARPAYEALCQQLGISLQPPRTFFMHMDSRRERNWYEVTWRELSPHCLSVLRSFCGPGEADYNSADLQIGPRQCVARFHYHPYQGPPCACEIRTGTVLSGPLTRRFGINELWADYEGKNDAQGVFRTWLTLEGQSADSDDFMYLSLRQFWQAVTGQSPQPLATMAEGLANQQLQLQLLARGRRVESHELN
jgi:predicted dehydrogenase